MSRPHGDSEMKVCVLVCVVITRMEIKKSYIGDIEFPVQDQEFDSLGLSLNSV